MHSIRLFLLCLITVVSHGLEALEYSDLKIFNQKIEKHWIVWGDKYTVESDRSAMVIFSALSAQYQMSSVCKTSLYAARGLKNILPEVSDKELRIILNALSGSQRDVTMNDLHRFTVLNIRLIKDMSIGLADRKARLYCLDILIDLRGFLNQVEQDDDYKHK